MTRIFKKQQHRPIGCGIVSKGSPIRSIRIPDWRWNQIKQKCGLSEVAGDKEVFEKVFLYFEDHSRLYWEVDRLLKENAALNAQLSNNFRYG